MGVGAQGILLGFTAFAYRIPLSWHLPAQLANTALSATMLPSRCALECAVAGRAQLYASVAGWLRSLADLLWVGLPAPLRPRCGCFVVGAWVDTFFGLLLPTWLLARADGAGSAAGSADSGGGKLARAASAVRHPAVLVASAALLWRLAEVAGMLVWPEL